MVGEKISLSGTCAILETSPSPPPGGRGVSRKPASILNLPGRFVIFLFFFVSEERVGKQLKQVSIVFI